MTFLGVVRQEGSLGSCPMLAEPASAFWLGLRHEDGNANRNGEALGEKMSTAPGQVPGSLPPGLVCCSVGHCWAGSPLPHTAGGSPFALGSSQHCILAHASGPGLDCSQGWLGRAGLHPSSHRAPRRKGDGKKARGLLAAPWVWERRAGTSVPLHAMGQLGLFQHFSFAL